MEEMRTNYENGTYATACGEPHPQLLSIETATFTAIPGMWPVSQEGLWLTYTSGGSCFKVGTTYPPEAPPGKSPAHCMGTWERGHIR